MAKRQLDFWATQAGEKMELERRLAGLYEILPELHRENEIYRHLLKPYWTERGDIIDAIQHTHHGSAARHPGLTYNPDGAEERKPMFAALMDLAAEWGTTKEEHKRLQAQIKGLTREAQKIRTELKYISNKGAKS